MKKAYINNLFWLGFFAIWMAYLESSIVVYLRALYYPDGFAFPIKFIPNNIAIIEIGREAATVFMMLAISFLLSKRGWVRTAYFMFCFGAWDIWYYIWLKIFLNWPPSLFTWDLLFLIPIAWSGPVWAPVLVSISLIFGAVVILKIDHMGIHFHLLRNEWLAFLTAPLLIFISFVLEAPRIMKFAEPKFFHWEILILAEIVGFLMLAHVVKRLKKQSDKI
ncbi:hypothetical protein JW960_06455 [candidate division KSB1 bacterium]|nr:hypothetical protein [candidate division KSB1 bacterium]